MTCVPDGELVYVFPDGASPVVLTNVFPAIVPE
jgi:hypothetical protein